MTRDPYPTLALLAVTSATLASGAALAQVERSPSRSAAARHQVERVCKPLRAQGRHAEAAACYAEIDAFRAGPAAERAHLALNLPRPRPGTTSPSFLILGVGF